MIKFLEIRPSLYLIEQPVDLPEGPKEIDPVNHLWILDRSGSMYHNIRQVVADVKEKIKKIPFGDYVSVGWFSSEGGQFRWVLKGAQVNRGAVDSICLAIDSMASTVALTCFSEILKDTSQVIEEISALSKSFSLCFFTDGYPVVSNYGREVEAIMEALKKIETRLVNAIFVGYGDYYNKDLLSRMAARAGGEFVHASDIKTFSLNLDRLIGDSTLSDGKVEVEPAVLSPDGIYFSLMQKGVALYETNDEDKIRLSPGDERLECMLYIVSDTVPDGARETITDMRAAYAAASVLVNKTKTDVAIDLLAKVGDKHAIDLVTNAFTNAEYGRAESELVTAVFEPKTRFREGVVRDYVPKADAFCLLDLLDLLLADPDAAFYPCHPDFKYKKIGVPSKTREGYPKFEADQNAKVPISSLTWNESKLNLSVLAKIPGIINLGEEAEAHGFSQKYPTFQYRNYALVRDGFLNVPTLPCYLSEKTGSYNKLLDEGVIEETFNMNTPVLLHLDRIPIINQEIASQNSAKALFEATWSELNLEACIKVFKFLRKEIDPEGTALLQSPLTAEQQAFLTSKGIDIKTGAYSPPKDDEKPTDKYFAKEFRIKVAGYSSLPKVDDVRQKFLSGVASDKVRGPAALFYPAFALYYGNPVATMDDKVKLQWLDSRLTGFKQALFRERSSIQRTKFAVILAKKWFQEFSSRSENTMEVNGQTFAIDLREVEVPI